MSAVSVIAGGYAAQIFEVTEYALERVSVFVQTWREALLLRPVDLVRDIGERTM